jgi:hypothetical protein
MFKTKTTILIILFNLIFIEVYSQLGFNRSLHINVLKTNGDTLKNAWAGGFNSVQFSEVDLNLDGIRDLLVFDKTGDRMSTFINDGVDNEVSYTYDPYYLQFFPRGLNNWVLMRDYNCDGKMDIMSYNSAGIKAYKNVSTTQLSFVLDTISIQTNYNPDGAGSFSPLYVGTTDLPAIDDIDGDGDLDILTFSILGAYVEYHKNLSVENTGSCGSFDYELSNKCWGFFHENNTNNGVTLYDTCDWNISNPQKLSGGNKHSGSTLLTLDVDANNSKDLVLGDVSFNNFVLLTNGDASPMLNKSSMTAFDSLFPQNNGSTIPVDISYFPAGFYLDVNNDSIKDLIASPNCLYGCKNDNNVWYYNNANADNNPDFNFIEKDFLQNTMIEVGEGAHPVFFDHNSDGLMDIIIGTYGLYEPSVGPLLYLAGLSLYENIGTTSNPSYQLITNDYANISTINLDLNNSRPTLGLHPTFSDLDGDNDMDMILGDYNGLLHHFTNTAGAGQTADFTLTAPDYFAIDVGNNATPLLYDLDNDGLNDLIIGKKAGTFSYYRNTGTTTVPDFTLITDSLGKVYTNRSFDIYGYSSPVIIDSAGTTQLFSGSINGSIYKFGNIDGNLTGTFSVDSNFQSIWEGVNSIVSITDINNDNKLDMLVGNQSGGLTYFDGSDTIVVAVNKNINLFSEINLYPNPTKNTINIDLGNNNLKNANIQIIDLFGKVLQNESVNTRKTTINLNNYSVGIYLVKFSNQNGSKVYKVIKE